MNLAKLGLGISAPRGGAPGAGGAGPALFNYEPGDSLAAFTASRVGGAYQRSNAGMMTLVASGVMRDAHYIGALNAGVRTLLQEDSATNFHDNFYCTSFASSSSANNAASGEQGPLPAGEQTRLITSSTAVSGEHWVQAPTPALAITDTCPWVIFAKYRDASVPEVHMRFNDPGNYVSIDLQTGAVTANSAAWLVAVTPWAAGYWRISVTRAASTAITTNCQLRFGTFAGSSVPVGEGFYLSGWQVERDAVNRAASSPIVTVGASASRNADELYLTSTLTPQAQTMFVDYIEERRWVGPAAKAVLCVGSTDMHGSNRLALGELSTYVNSTYRSGGTQREISQTLNQTFGQRIRVVMNIDAAGVLNSSYRVDEGVEQFGTPQAALALPGAWDGNMYFLGQQAIRKAVVAAGVKTMAEMEAY